MKTGMGLMAERGINMTAENWSEQDFRDAKLPMVVQCRDCTSTLALPCAFIDGENYTYCCDCAECYEE